MNQSMSKSPDMDAQASITSCVCNMCTCTREMLGNVDCRYPIGEIDISRLNENRQFRFSSPKGDIDLIHVCALWAIVPQAYCPANTAPCAEY